MIFIHFYVRFGIMKINNYSCDENEPHTCRSSKEGTQKPRSASKYMTQVIPFSVYFLERNVLS